MLFTRLLQQILLLTCLVVLASCASNGGKSQTNGEAKPAKPYDYEKMKRRPVSLNTFGDNPYLQTQVQLSPQAISEYQFAVRALQGGNQDLGELQLKNMVEEYPDLSGPAYNLAALNKERGDIEKALEYITIALERNNDNFDAHNLYASIQREKGDFEAAEAVYLDILSRWGGYAPAYRNLGVLYDLYLGDPVKAIVFYRQYNVMLPSPDSQVEGWIVDIERRYKMELPQALPELMDDGEALEEDTFEEYEELGESDE